jgi:cytochrome b subunit of formate dehydrogenase
MTNRALTRLGLRLGSALLGLFLGAAGANLRAADAATDCTSCHDQGPKLAKSAHQGLPCQVCHESHDTYPHPANIPKPACATCHPSQAADYASGVHGQARKSGDESAPDCGVCHGSAHELVGTESQSFRAAVPDMCGMCHTGEADQYKGSVHGKALARGVVQAPMCTDCHGSHKIMKPTNEASPVNGLHIRDTCGNCHGNVRLAREFGLPSDRLVSFDSSYHGLAAKAGSQTVANCASCHGVHNILPSSDPNSTINPKNLAKTCGQCHPGAGTRFAISQVHLSTGGAEPAVLRVVREFYLLMIPVTIGLMLLHQGGDWIRKLLRLRFGKGTARPPAGHGGLRMLPFERFEHAAMAASFMILVWTGFALRYPDQWWARPLLLMEGARSMRSLIHRTAAVVFLAVALAHVVSLIVSRKLRVHWMEMIPKLRDGREAHLNFAYNLGLGKVPPPLSPHSYIEKAEYWAVVWGAVVMAGSGLLLWANNLAMRFLPKVWLDVATSVHFYEAVLATLAIVVWHLYSVIFDPDVYPLNTAFLTGRSVKQSGEDEEPETPAPAGD